MRFRLSTAAKADLGNIRAWTLERWGRAQWLEYHRDLARTFEQIAAALETGRRRDEFRPGLCSMPCRSHMIFYRRLDGGVLGVVRILHARQNAAALHWAEAMER